MSKTRYHVNPETGKTGQCSATVKGCQFAKDGMIPEHYDNEVDARKAYEKQNEENTFSNNIKRDSKKLTTEEEVNNKSLKDALENTYITVGLRDIQDKRSKIDYATFLTNKETFKDAVDNINNEYDRLKNSERLTASEYINKLNESEGLNEGVTIVDSNNSDDANNKNADYVYNADLLHNGNLLLVTTHKAYIEPTAPLKQKEISMVISGDDDIYYDDWDDDDLNNAEIMTEYEYDINDDDKELLTNQEKFEVAKQYKDIIDNPNVPNWIMMPQQINSEGNLIKNTTKITEEESKINQNKHYLQVAESSRKKVAEKTTELQESKEKLEKLKNFIKDNDNIDESVKESLQEAAKNQRNSINKREEELRKLRSEGTLKKIQIYKNEIKEAENNIKKYNMSIFENDIASRYPSTDPAEREMAARKWITENKKNLPDMNNYLDYRKNVLDLDVILRRGSN